ncbi:MAG: hypothetical protein ABL888_22670 [Pirellulaceae bacterium]
MVNIKQICKRAVFSFNQSHFEIPQKPTNGEPEIIPNHDDALQTSAVTLPQSRKRTPAALLTVGLGWWISVLEI